MNETQTNGFRSLTDGLLGRSELLAWRFATEDGCSAYQKEPQTVGQKYILPHSKPADFVPKSVLPDLAHFLRPVVSPVIKPGLYGYHGSLSPLVALLHGNNLFAERVLLSGVVLMDVGSMPSAAASERTTLWRAFALPTLLSFSAECSERALDAVAEAGLSVDDRSRAVLVCVRDLMSSQTLESGKRYAVSGEAFGTLRMRVADARSAKCSVGDLADAFEREDSETFCKTVAVARAATAACQTGIAALAACEPMDKYTPGRFTDSVVYNTMLAVEAVRALDGHVDRNIHMTSPEALWQQRRLHTLLMGLAPQGYEEKTNG